MNRRTSAIFSTLPWIVLAAVAAPGAFAAEEDGTVAVGVTAESGAWPVDEKLEDGVLPIRVRIENRSDQALKLRYRDLALVGFSGDRYTALPLHDVLLTGRMPEEKDRKISIKVPKFAQISFRIAPSYSEIFPNSEAFPSHFKDNQDYADYHRKQWNPERKPTLDMFTRLLPEGVLDAGGWVSGFLYFQKVDGWERGLRFEMDVVAADGDETFATVNVPVTAAAER